MRRIVNKSPNRDKSLLTRASLPFLELVDKVIKNPTDTKPVEMIAVLEELMLTLDEYPNHKLSAESLEDMGLDAKEVEQITAERNTFYNLTSRLYRKIELEGKPYFTDDEMERVKTLLHVYRAYMDLPICKDGGDNPNIAMDASWDETDDFMETKEYLDAVSKIES